MKSINMKTIIVILCLLLAGIVASGSNPPIIETAISLDSYSLIFHTDSSVTDVYIVVGEEFFPANFNTSTGNFYYTFKMESIHNGQTISYILLEGDHQSAFSYTISIGSVTDTSANSLEIFTSDIFTKYIPIFTFTCMIILRFILPIFKIPKEEINS